MNRSVHHIVVFLLFLAMTAAARAGDSVEIRLKDGSKWRGELSQQVEVTYLEQRVEVKMSGSLIKAADLYITIEGDVAGQIRAKTIFRDDIVSMRTLDGAAASDRPVAKRDTAKSGSPGASGGKGVPLDAAGKPMGVMVLPLEGTVGGRFRKEEIIEIGKEADELGPGQIIVLLINSNGGSSLESQYIADEIFKIRERHRVVAWIQKAISAGCQTAMCCQEIYFMTEGSAGAVTTWNPGTGQSIKGEDLQRAIDHLVDIAKKSGYSEHIARSMKTNSALCSYTKDPETGEVTFYGDLSGEHVLSDGNSNLSFTSSTALDCGFSKGTADTEEELAALLDLPKWYEVSDHGRKIAKSWQDTCERAETEIPRLIARRGYWKTSGDIVERIGALITINQRLIRWWDRAPNMCQMQGLPAKEFFERENDEYRKQLADIKKNRR